MANPLDLLELETGYNIELETGAAIALESYSFRWTNLPGYEYNAADTVTIYAEQLNDILDRLDALGG